MCVEGSSGGGPHICMGVSFLEVGRFERGSAIIAFLRMIGEIKAHAERGALHIHIYFQ